MSNRYNFFYFEAEFKKYLIAGNAQDSTVKNYASDLHYFFLWLKATDNIDDLDLSDLPYIFTHALLLKYQLYLSSTPNAENTTTRRFATMRKFFTFCLDQRWLSSNPLDTYDQTTKLDQRKETISKYRESLKSKLMNNEELDRHINVIKDLVINFQTL